MDHREQSALNAEDTLAWARDLLAVGGARPDLKIDGKLTVKNFYEWISYTNEFLRHGITKSQVQATKDYRERLRDWCLFCDNYELAHRRNPIIAYEPAYEKSAEFHRSLAYVRYLICGNGTGKTTQAFAEDFRIATNTDPFRKLGGQGPRHVGIVGLDFTKYKPNVFEPKWLTGEPDNYLSPLLPEDGLYFHSYDKKQAMIRLACGKCVKAGRPRQCWHEKSKVSLFSDIGGWEAFQGGTYNGVHIDEHVHSEFYNEALERTKRGNTRGCIVVSGTPLFGPDAWEVVKLLNRYTGPPELNHISEQDQDSPRFVDVFEVSQRETGFMTNSEIEAKRLEYSEAEFEARINGKPIPLAKAPVFSLRILDEREKAAFEPKHGMLEIKPPVKNEDPTITIEDLTVSAHLTWTEQTVRKLEAKNWTGLRVWELPQEDGHYAIGVDTAEGLSPTNRDASCAHVFKLYPSGACEQVASFYGWIQPHDYANEIKKLAVWYNEAIIVPESTGLGIGLIERIVRQLGYYNVFEDTNRSDIVSVDQSARYGIRTGPGSKPMMVAAAQRLVHQGLAVIRDSHTYTEMRSFDQTRGKDDKGRHITFAGSDNARDDRVMAFALLAYAVVYHMENIYLLTHVVAPPAPDLTDYDLY